MTQSPSSSLSTAVISLFPELLGMGGIQESGRQSARALNELCLEHGWRLEVLSLNDEFGLHSLPPPDDHVRFRAFGRRKIFCVLWMLWRQFSLKRYTNLTVIAAHPNLAILAWLMKIFSGSIRTIVMTHGVEVWNRLPTLRWRALLHADLVLGPSTYTVQRLTQVQGIVSSKVRRLAWPLSADFLAMAEFPGRLTLPRDFPQGQIVLTVGRLASSERYKGIDDLIHATVQLRATFPTLQLVVVGQGDDLSRLQKLSVDEGVGDAVHFLAGLVCEELAACYANADVFAMPSTGEGFGLVFLEAMAFAKPVIGAAYGGTTDLVLDGITAY